MPRIASNVSLLALLAVLSACTIKTTPDTVERAPASSSDDDGSAQTPTTSGSKRASSSTTSTSDTTTTTTITDENDYRLPDEVTVTAHLPRGAKATHTLAGETIISFLTVDGSSPSLSPLPTNGATPNLAAKDVELTIESPATDDCEPDVKLFYNTTQLGVQITASDSAKGTDPSCYAWLDNVALRGLQVTVRNVPWSNVPTSSTERATVRVSLQ